MLVNPPRAVAVPDRQGLRHRTFVACVWFASGFGHFRVWVASRSITSRICHACVSRCFAHSAHAAIALPCRKLPQVA